MLGVYDDRAPERLTIPANLELQGRINELYDDVNSGKVDTVFITLPMTANRRIEQILRVLGDTPAPLCGEYEPLINDNGSSGVDVHFKII